MCCVVQCFTSLEFKLSYELKKKEMGVTVTVILKYHMKNRAREVTSKNIALGVSSVEKRSI